MGDHPTGTRFESLLGLQSTSGTTEGKIIALYSNFRYTITLGDAMHSMIWVLILAPPCLAFLIWQGIGIGSRTGDIVPVAICTLA